MTDDEHPEFDRLTVDEAIRMLESRMYSRLELSKYVAWSLADVTALQVVLTELKKLREQSVSSSRDYSHDFDLYIWSVGW